MSVTFLGERNLWLRLNDTLFNETCILFFKERICYSVVLHLSPVLLQSHHFQVKSLVQTTAVSHSAALMWAVKWKLLQTRDWWEMLNAFSKTLIADISWWGSKKLPHESERGWWVNKWPVRHLGDVVTQTRRCVVYRHI